LSARLDIFEQNNAIVNRLADLFEQYTVGPNGLQFIPSSSDEDWNQRAAASWAQWTDVCDLTSLHAISTLMTLTARSWFIDGEVFILLTRGEERSATANLKPVLRPRIQLIESHRVATPPQLQDQEGKTVSDGIEIDAKGRPTAYWIKDSADGDIFTADQPSRSFTLVSPPESGCADRSPFYIRS
jgi:capsid protein